MATAAEQRPKWWKTTYKNHFSVLRQWRKRKLEEGYVWSESTGLYAKPNPYAKPEPARPTPAIYQPPRVNTEPLTDEQRHRNKELIAKVFPKLARDKDMNQIRNDCEAKGSSMRKMTK